ILPDKLSTVLASPCKYGKCLGSNVVPFTLYSTLPTNSLYFGYPLAPAYNARWSINADTPSSQQLNLV
uniref:hypothetical protein n=1 Tax=Clostridioides difficile TaxID=1496 RepID=UPI001CA57714